MRNNWAWRAGMATYRFSINTFFRAGGLSWLRRKYREGVDERMGNFSGVPQNGLWFHAVSVGEVQSASALIKRMREDCARPCVLSTITTTGQKMAHQLLDGTVDRMIYSPWDAPRFVTSALEVVGSDASASSDARTLLLAQLQEIQKKARKAKAPDSVTKAHWQAIAQQIAKELE